MSNMKKLTEGEGGGGGGEEGGESILNCNITSSRCKLFCSLFVGDLIFYRESSKVLGYSVVLEYCTGH